MRGQTPKACAAMPLAAGAARNLAQFFAPNGPHHEQEGELGTPKTPTSAEKNGGSHKSDISDPMWRTVTAKRAFLDPNAFYPDVEITDSSILDAVLNTTYEPSRSWSEICTTNLGTPPEPGSFVEFVHQHEIHFGVVLREPYARFNRYHNRMIVLTLHNDLVKVYPQDITFCMHRVLDGAEIRRHEILINRFNESYDARARLVQILHQFMALIAAHKHLVSHALKACHSNVASDEKASPVCLSDIAVFVSALDPSAAFSRALPSYFHQSALLMAIYLEMCTDPSRWMVPGCIPSERTTNLSFCASSNTLAPPPLLFAAPVPVLDDVSKFMHLDKKHMAAFSSFLESLIQSPIKYDDLVLQFGIWDAARFKSALKAMMYAIIYPHPHLLHKLSTMPVFGAASGAAGASAVSSESITKLLNAIGLYDNPQNALTDPFMSAGIFGRVKKLSLIASSTKDLDTSSVHHSASVEAKKRSSKITFPIYGPPDSFSMTPSHTFFSGSIPTWPFPWKRSTPAGF
ncbi:hypothetical protein JCM33374_g4342 [Metschnikowia sp. JCM 33374]|nr:hypothetical protein JCM33374_g4342 [Metschnikowia sp. JCM 33374]